MRTVSLILKLAMVLPLLLLLPETSSSQSVDEGTASNFDKKLLVVLEQQLNDLHKAKKFSGAVLIAERGKIAFEKSVGYEDPRKEIPLGPKSSFRLASVSKAFTAMAIILLEKEGKLNFDDDIQKHLPDLPYTGIAIRHLLHHTGGLPDYMGLAQKHWHPDVEVDKRKPVTNEVVQQLFAKHKPKALFKPGDKWEYSNTGYSLLGRIVTVASGMPCQEFVDQKIFAPLEMKHSKAFTTGEKGFNLDHRVYGFQFLRRKSKWHRLNDWNFLNGVFGDGGVYTSARDLLKWDQALYTEKLVPKKLLDQAFTPATLNNGKKTDYGFGWIVLDRGDQKAVTHSGAWVGFRTYIFRDLSNQTVLIVLSNSSGKGFDEITATSQKAFESWKQPEKPAGKN